MQSVPITTDVASSNLGQSKVSQHYVIKFVSDLRQVGGFLRQDITEILLKRHKTKPRCNDIHTIILCCPCYMPGSCIMPSILGTYFGI